MLINQLENTLDYLNEVLGLEAKIVPFDKVEVARLPVFFKNAYTFQRVHLNHQEALLAIVRDSNGLSPHQLRKQEERLQLEFGKKVIFSFDWLEAYQRKRLVQNKIAFIVPGKQLYVPFLFMDLNETQSKQVEEREKLRPASQCLLLYHLQVERLDQISFKDVALKLKYSNMTITRAAKELAAVELAEVVGSRTKGLRFTHEGKELWEESKQVLLSPAKERLFISQLPEDAPLFKANETALAHYTELAEGRRPAYAVGDEAYRLLKESHSSVGISEVEGDYVVEVWNYDPKLLMRNGVVDPLSLYLSMMEIEDERVQIALEQLINNMKW